MFNDTTVHGVRYKRDAVLATTYIHAVSESDDGDEKRVFRLMQIINIIIYSTSRLLNG